MELMGMPMRVCAPAPHLEAVREILNYSNYSFFISHGYQYDLGSQILKEQKGEI